MHYFGVADPMTLTLSQKDHRRLLAITYGYGGQWQTQFTPLSVPLIRCH